MKPYFFKIQSTQISQENLHAACCLYYYRTTELRVRHTRQHIQKIRARWHHPNALHARAHRKDEMRRWSCPAAYACAAAQQSPGSCDVDRPVPASRDAGQLGLQGLQLRADALGVLGAVLAALPVLRTSLGQAGGPRLGLGRRLRSPLLLRLKTWVAQTSASWLCGGFLQRHIMPQTVSWAALAWPHWPWFQHRVAPARPPSAASPRPAG